MYKIACSVIALLMCVHIACAQQKIKRPKTKTQNSKTEMYRGVSSAQELGQYVFAALQANQFSNLVAYFPSEADINQTDKTTPDDDLKLILENTSPSEVVNKFQHDFTELQNKSIEQKVNFNELKLTEVQAGSAPKANRVFPIVLTLSTPANQTMQLQFEAIKIRGRYFLFEHIAAK